MPETDRKKRVAQVAALYRLARDRDPRLPLLVAGPALLAVAVLVVVGVLIGQTILLSVLGVLVGALVALLVFNRRAGDAAYAQIEGQPGAAAGVLNALRGDWRVTPAVAVTRAQDVVHRAVGRPGVVLVGEGSPGRVAQLLAQEKKRVGRVVGDTPVYDVIVGNGDGQVPLRRLQQHLMRLPRNLRPAQVGPVETRLRALGGAAMPIPKGPLPRNLRMPRGQPRLR